MVKAFTFGIMDLMIFVTAVAALVAMCRPVQVRENTGVPWLYGVWTGDKLTIWLYPDGYYGIAPDGDRRSSAGHWTVFRVDHNRDVFRLTLEKHEFLVRTKWGSGVLDIMNPDGSVQSELRNHWRLEGSFCNGTADGRWILVYSDGCGSWVQSQEHLMYVNGEIVDVQGVNGERDLVALNALRIDRGLRPLAKSDFREDAAEAIGP